LTLAIYISTISIDGTGIVMITQWDAHKINVFLDICTYCNAGCPQCHRTNPNGLQKQDWLPLVQWSLADFKTAFPRKTLRHINHFHFCGTYGDPMMVKDIYEIVEYIIKNSNSKIKFDTNGAMRNEDFWWDISVLGSDRLTLAFDVDGINEEMHAHYRRFTSLEKVLDHMNIASQTNCNVHVQTILFKHNQDYKEEIRALCKENGATHHEFMSSNRFDSGPVTHHVDENGNPFILEEVTKVKASRRPDLIGERKIVCKWAKPKNEVVVNFDGQVLPCCYHQNPYSRKFRGLLKDNDELYNKYEKDKLKYNVLHTPLKDIIESKWFSEDLPDSIENKPLEICTAICSRRV